MGRTEVASRTSEPRARWLLAAGVALVAVIAGLWLLDDNEAQAPRAAQASERSLDSAPSVKQGEQDQERPAERLASLEPSEDARASTSEASPENDRLAAVLEPFRERVDRALTSAWLFGADLIGLRDAIDDPDIDESALSELAFRDGKYQATALVALGLLQGTDASNEALWEQVGDIGEPGEAGLEQKTRLAALHALRLRDQKAPPLTASQLGAWTEPSDSLRNVTALAKWRAAAIANYTAQTPRTIDCAVERHIKTFYAFPNSWDVLDQRIARTNPDLGFTQPIDNARSYIWAHLRDPRFIAKIRTQLQNSNSPALPRDAVRGLAAIGGEDAKQALLEFRKDRRASNAFGGARTEMFAAPSPWTPVDLEFLGAIEGTDSARRRALWQQVSELILPDSERDQLRTELRSRLEHTTDPDEARHVIRLWSYFGRPEDEFALRSLGRPAELEEERAAALAEIQRRAT